MILPLPFLSDSRGLPEEYIDRKEMGLKSILAPLILGRLSAVKSGTLVQRQLFNAEE